MSSPCHLAGHVRHRTPSPGLICTFLSFFFFLRVELHQRFMWRYFPGLIAGAPRGGEVKDIRHHLVGRTSRISWACGAPLCSTYMTRSTIRPRMREFHHIMRTKVPPVWWHRGIEEEGNDGLMDRRSEWWIYYRSKWDGAWSHFLCSVD